jgi:hypothetical protein
MSHNSAATKCKLGGFLHLSWLDCQKDSVGKQLNYGVRGFDLRLRQTGSEIYCAHGLCPSTPLREVLQEIRDFRVAHHREFIYIEFCSYFNDGKLNGPQCAALIDRYLSLSEFAFPSDTPYATATMGDLWNMGKNYMVLCPWVEERYRSPVLGRGTFSPDVNFGPISDGDRLFRHVYSLLDTNPGPLVLTLGRSSGSSAKKQKPIDYMLHDRPNFLNLIDYLEQNRDKLAKVRGFWVDATTHDYILTGNIIKLNVAKGLVKSFLAAEFLTLLMQKIQ